LLSLIVLIPCRFWSFTTPTHDAAGDVLVCPPVVGAQGKKCPVDLVHLGFVAAPQGEVDVAADRGVAGMNAIVFTRNFAPPLAEKPRQKV
jgi:hypothetical protein